MITHDEIITAVKKTALAYPIKTVSYFGSYADGQPTNESDLDLLIEFHKPTVSLIALAGIKIDLEEQLKISVDVIHAPVPSDSFIEFKKVVQVYG